MFLKVNPFTYILPYELGEIYPLESTSRVSENSLKPQIEILISSPGPNLKSGGVGILSKKLMSWFEEKYIDKDQLLDWRAAPILYKNLSGLPKSLIVVAGCDPLKDEGVAYGQALIKAGNSSEIVNFDGQIHGFLTMGARIKDTEKLVNLLSKKISEAFQ